MHSSVGADCLVYKAGDRNTDTPKERQNKSIFTLVKVPCCRV